MLHGTLKNLYGVNSILVLVGPLLLIIVFLACRSTNEVTLIYQENNLLIGSSDDKKVEYFNDVIDYSYEPYHNILFVLHSERSDNIDEVGMSEANLEGLTVGGFIRVYQISKSLEDDPVQLYESDFTKMNPWSIDEGDFERDGISELFIGCYRATEFYEASRRPFIISWNGEIFYKKWTGSYIGFESFLSGEIKDSDLDGFDELVLKVMNQFGEIEERAYKWGNFTFDRIK